ncbi:SDR family oxidoreductase [Tropheryma whipplei]|uniref:Putative exidoreductase n=1 Tax=Tropheryma whipplei (strain Twist) TaxID=203267 RepID=Q83MY0_TROWT|nr:SDR family oxidoreductase [Tropheryma whipplei]AAO44418.1 putative exidoreductase [Tropheryma whipplei str. Twist]
MTDLGLIVFDSDVLRDKNVLITGGSRGIGAKTAYFLAQGGAQVSIVYRNGAARADKVLHEIESGTGIKGCAVRADITTDQDVLRRFLKEKVEKLDILILNASGGMESGMPGDYPMRLNRDAQLNTVETCLPFMPAGSRVVFVTSHQAHFITTCQTLPEYEKVALSKRAGEDALVQKMKDIPYIGFVVVSGDMIVGTVTAMLINRLYPGALDERRNKTGKLYDVSEFAAEVARAAIDPIPEGNIKFVGDISTFLTDTEG